MNDIEKRFKKVFGENADPEDLIKEGFIPEGDPFSPGCPEGTFTRDKTRVFINFGLNQSRFWIVPKNWIV